MKKVSIFLAFLTLSLSAYAQNTEVIRLSDPVQETETHEVFGTEVDQWNEARSLVSIIESEEDMTGKEVTLETEVAKVCQKKGCFFVANESGYSARITFKHYSFFIPTDAQGKRVKLKGVFTVKDLTEEQARHYAVDAGEDTDQISGPKKEYSIVATSIMIPKS